jgi:hypothetical protein
MFQVVNRCFQILQSRSEDAWRKAADLVISPDVRGIDWDGFQLGPQMIAAGEAAAREALPIIQGWLGASVETEPGFLPGTAEAEAEI